MAGGALIVLVATIAGCGTFMNSRQQALDKATAAVRAAAEQARVEQISKTSGGRVVRKAAGPDGTVDLEGTFIELRNSGGGGSYEDAAVLLCVRLSGKPGPQARVELADAPCPTNPTSRPPNFGSIDKIVTLS